MSDPFTTWYSLRDLESLGARQAELGGKLELQGLRRLEGLLAEQAGEVEATLAVRRSGAGVLVLGVHLRASVKLVCQRCLEPLAHEVDEHVDLALLESAALETVVPEGSEPLLLENGRLQPAQLIEDELIVALPLVPKHARAADCGTLGREVEVQARRA